MYVFVCVQVDRDGLSFSAEHDASRLNFSLLWQFLQTSDIASELPAFFPYYCMIAGMRKASVYAARCAEIPHAAPALEAWLVSWGQTPPTGEFVSLSARMPVCLCIAMPVSRCICALVCLYVCMRCREVTAK